MKKHGSKIILLAVIVAAVLVCFLNRDVNAAIGRVFEMFASGDFAVVGEFIAQYGAYAMAVSFGLMILQSVIAPLPAFLITFANANLFGWWQGAILSWSSAMAGAAMKGANLIAVLPDTLKSPMLTAEWEHRLKQVERGEMDAAAFMDGIAGLTAELVESNTAPLPQYAALFPRPDQGEPVGVCPRCGGAVVEQKKGFFCENRACAFAIWKDNRFFAAKKKAVTKTVVAALLKDGRVSMKGLFSEKTGKTYDATVLLDDPGGKYVNFKLEFPVLRFTPSYTLQFCY